METNNKAGVFLLLCILFWAAQPANAAQAKWNLVANGSAGPIVFVRVASSGNVNMGVMVAFEYERKCEPLFTYLEFSSPIGAPLGTPTNKYRIENPNIGVIHNSYFYTWYAAKIVYPQGFEVAFGVTSELWKALMGPTNSLIFVREDGAQFQLPVYGLKEKLLQALNYCRSRF